MLLYLGCEIDESVLQIQVAPVAQPVEHMTFNHGVRSSILRRSTSQKPRLVFAFGAFAIPGALRTRQRRIVFVPNNNEPPKQKSVTGVSLYQ